MHITDRCENIGSPPFNEVLGLHVSETGRPKDAQFIKQTGRPKDAQSLNLKSGSINWTSYGRLVYVVYFYLRDPDSTYWGTLRFMTTIAKWMVHHYTVLGPCGVFDGPRTFAHKVASYRTQY